MIKVGVISYGLLYTMPYRTVLDILTSLLEAHQHMICYINIEGSKFDDYATYAANLLQDEYPDRKIEVVCVQYNHNCNHEIIYDKAQEKARKFYLGLPVIPVINRYIVPDELANMEREEGFINTNKWIVHNSDYIIASICNPDTYIKDDIEYAKQLGKTIYLIERIN